MKNLSTQELVEEVYKTFDAIKDLTEGKRWCDLEPDDLERIQIYFKRLEILRKELSEESH